MTGSILLKNGRGIGQPQKSYKKYVAIGLLVFILFLTLPSLCGGHQGHGHGQKASFKYSKEANENFQNQVVHSHDDHDHDHHHHHEHDHHHDNGHGHHTHEHDHVNCDHLHEAHHSPPQAKQAVEPQGNFHKILKFFKTY